MADFDLQFVTAAPAVNVEDWLDPEVSGKPSRLNPRPGIPHRYRLFPYDDSISLTFGAIVGGVDRPLDSALGGRLFLWSWVDLPNSSVYVPLITPTAARSSELVFPAGTFKFLGDEQVGHYTLLCSRDGGGAVGISWEIAL